MEATVGRLIQQGDHAYYERRARNERVMAEAARDPAARRSHLMLAEQYERIATGSLHEWDDLPR